ncbi:MAG: hypothetical protein IAF38_04460 [Bacteroidia bacterium]|nr:hypothetical protein [Bacteroidia bacterium]
MNKAEKNELLDFVCSPFFNKNKELILLYKELLRAFSLLREVIDEKKIYEKVSTEKFTEQKLRYLLSDLNLLIEHFFSVKKWDEHADLKKQLLIENLSQKKLNKYVQQHQQALLLNTEKNLLQDSDFLGIKLHSEESSFKFASEYDNRSVDSRLQKLSDSIDVYYLAKKLKYACEMINRRNVLQVNYSIHFIDEIKAFLKSSDFLKVPAISLYFHILNSLLEPEEEKHYRALKSGLTLHKNVFSKTELRDMFTFAQNYCIRRLNTGQSNFLEEIFSNYEFLLEEKIILVNNNLSQFDFKNIVTIALRLHKYVWVQKFINSYISFLPLSERKNAEVYNLSRLYYSNGETKKALQLMQNVEFTDIYYHLDAKVLLVKIYYDTSSTESLLPLFTSFKNYLQRNKKVSDYQQLTYQNFLKTVVKMFNYKLFDKGNLEAIRSTLLEAKNIADINWLKEKSAELV